MRTCRRMAIRTVAVHSSIDAHALHVEQADEAYLIGGPRPAESYPTGERIIAVAKACGAEAIQPGYGFLSENAGFARAVESAGLVFIGPTPGAIEAMGLKGRAKAIMEKAGVPVVPGYHGEEQDDKFLTAEAKKIGFPLLVKAVAGGGGKGMRLVNAASEFEAQLAAARGRGGASAARASRDRIGRARDRGAALRRESAQRLPSGNRAHRRDAIARGDRRGAAARHGRARGRRRHDLLRSDDREAHRVGRRPRRGRAPHPRGAARDRDPRRQDEPRFPRAVDRASGVPRGRYR